MGKDEFKMQKRIKKLDPTINQITYKDGRGVIQTYFPERENIVEWNYIVTLKNSVRGHHFYKEFDEYSMVVEGEGVYSELTGGREIPTPVGPGDCVFIPTGVPHTFYPVVDTKFIAMLTKCWDDCDEPITLVEVKNQ